MGTKNVARSMGPGLSARHKIIKRSKKSVFTLGVQVFLHIPVKYKHLSVSKWEIVVKRDYGLDTSD